MYMWGVFAFETKSVTEGGRGHGGVMMGGIQRQKQ